MVKEAVHFLEEDGSEVLWSRAFRAEVGAIREQDDFNDSGGYATAQG